MTAVPIVRSGLPTLSRGLCGAGSSVRAAVARDVSRARRPPIRSHVASKRRANQRAVSNGGILRGFRRVSIRALRDAVRGVYGARAGDADHLNTKNSTSYERRKQTKI